jgi:hypothetical protein
MKFHKKKLAVLLLLAISVVMMSFRDVPEEKKEAPKFTNLKVLSKKISHDDLIAVMKNYNTALGVKCNYCHAKVGDKMDFASDEKQEKNIARKMQKMANAINKKYFGGNSGTVACMTCHNGKANPTEGVTKPTEGAK